MHEKETKQLEWILSQWDSNVKSNTFSLVLQGHIYISFSLVLSSTVNSRRLCWFDRLPKHCQTCKKVCLGTWQTWSCVGFLEQVGQTSVRNDAGRRDPALGEGAGLNYLLWSSLSASYLMISLPWGKVTHWVWSFCLECPKNFTSVTCGYITSYLSGHHFFIPPSFFYLGAIHKLTHFLRLFIKVLLNHANWKHNETMWILGAENNLWHSTHFAVCTFPTGVCCQEDFAFRILTHFAVCSVM